ncbi:MAG: hypothetical protein P9L92_11220 [Candidatus Electryonea clarkiae]|nr:hypothetical protein [Candidatus Electryonea clarkiae]MDP8288075.1 hypothetical protein [Candidatus Electryonea clarkiae]
MYIKELVLMYGIAHRVLIRNLKEISDEESLTFMQPGGNCINWVVGHILVSRNDLLVKLGKDSIINDEYYTLYKRGTEGNINYSAFPLSGMVEILNESIDSVMKAIEMIKYEDLKEVDHTGESDDNIVGELAFFHFHESYHIGQVGILRRLLGKEGVIR